MTRKLPGSRHVFAVGTATYQDGWGDLPGVADDVDTIIGVLGSFGYRPARGFDHGLIDPAGGLDIEDQLMNWAEAEHGDDDTLIIYYAGHGVNEGAHYLVCGKTPYVFERRTMAALPTSRLLELASRAGIRRLLVILDTCYAGDGAADSLALAVKNHIVAAASDTEQRRHWQSLEVLAAARCGEPAADGQFASALAAVLRDQVIDQPILAGNRPRYVHLADVVGAINRMFEAQGIPQRADHAQMHHDGAGFLPNPHYAAHLPEEFDLAEQHVLTTERGVYVLGLADHFGPRARGVHSPGQTGHYFTGRTAILTRLARWLRGQGDRNVNVFQVTGGPGTGKSSVLARIVALADPALRADIPDSTVVVSTDVKPGAVDLAIHAARRTADQIFETFATMLRAPGSEPDVLLTTMRAREHPLTVVIDALDEAGNDGSGRDCQQIMDFLRVAAAQIPQLHLLLGARPHVFDRYPALGSVVKINLDLPDWGTHGDITSYIMQLLSAPHGPGSETDIPETRLARAAINIADIAGRNYLVARLIARALAASMQLWPSDPGQWHDLFPAPADSHETAAQSISASFRWAMNTQMGAQKAAQAREMLLPLAYAKGAGMPLAAVWPASASACAGRPVSEHELVRLLDIDAAAPYIIEALDSHGRSVYRLYHQALADDLCQEGEEPLHQRDNAPESTAPRSQATLKKAIFERLLATVPLTGDEKRDWQHADPYILDHVSSHAVDSGQVDVLLKDAEYLIHVGPPGLLPALNDVRTPAGKLTAAVYRGCVEHLRDATPECRRRALAINAVRLGANALSRQLHPTRTAHEFWPRWSTGEPQFALRNTLAGHVSYVEAVACTVIDDRPVVITGSHDSTARLWDLSTGRQSGLPLIHSDGVRATACATVGDTPVAVTVDWNGMLSLWNLRSSQQIGDAVEVGNRGVVDCVACTTVQGRLVAVAGGERNDALRLWELSPGGLTQASSCEVLSRRPGWIRAVSCTRLHGIPVAVSTDGAGTVTVWDLTSRKQMGETMTDDDEDYYLPAVSIRCGELSGRPVAVVLHNDHSQSEGEKPFLRVWDLSSRKLMSRIRCTGDIRQLACTVMDGRLVAIMGDYENGMIQRWDLDKRRLIGKPFKGNFMGILAMDSIMLDGKPVAVAGGHDTTVQIYDLSPQRSRTRSRLGHDHEIEDVQCLSLKGQPVAVTASKSAIKLWNLATGDELGATSANAEKGLSCASSPDGKAFAVARNWQGADVWNLVHLEKVGELSKGGESYYLAVTIAWHHDKFIAITSDHESVKVWDLAALEVIDTLPVNDRIEHLACFAVPGGDHVVIGCGGKGIWRWHLSRRRRSTKPVGPGTHVMRIAGIFNEGRLLAATIRNDYDYENEELNSEILIGEVCVRDLVSGELISRHETTSGDFIHALELASVGNSLLAVSGGKDRLLRIWDVAENGMRESWSTPGQINSVAYSPYGSLVVGVESDVLVMNVMPKS